MANLRGDDEDAELARAVNVLLDAARALILPRANTPSNCEVLAMSCSHWTAARVHADKDLSEAMRAALGDSLFALLNTQAQTDEARILQNAMMASVTFTGGEVVNELLVVFLREWRNAAYARLEIGARLAAALALTDAPPAADVRAPWPAWSLLVPNDLFGTEPFANLDSQLHWSGERLWSVARIWCVEAQPVFVVPRCGLTDSEGAPIAEDIEPIAFADLHERLAEPLRCLVAGACLVASDPQRLERRGSHGGRSTRRGRHGPPPQGTHYKLAAPVQIDLREKLREALAGTRRGGSPKVQFLVRGHWRRQAHGEGRASRKLIWIEPFWKGPEEARILLRPHHVKGGAS